MGSVKPSYIKNFAMDLLRTYESSFSPDFEQNKLKVSEYTDIKNKTIRNRVAGYISNVMRQRSTRRGEVEIAVSHCDGCSRFARLRDAAQEQRRRRKSTGSEKCHD